MKKIEFGIQTAHIQSAAALIIGYYFDYNDNGENLEAHEWTKEDRGGYSHIFGKRDFIRFEWDGPNHNGMEQYGNASAEIITFTNGKYDHEKDVALQSLFNLGGYYQGYREVLTVNEDYVELCAKYFDEESINDLVHYVKTQKTDPSRQNRTYVKIIPWSETTFRYEFVVVDQNMGYDY